MKKKVKQERGTRQEGKKKEMVETTKLVDDREIAYDFAVRVYERFNKLVKSIILFGSSAKKTSSSQSDIDIIIIIDDCSIQWDEELIAWYREELRKLISIVRYKKALHINTVKLSSWWADLIRGDPIVINVIRYGEALVDFGGFFNPLKVLLYQGKIKSSPEAIYTALQRAPIHIARSRSSMLNSIEAMYWAMVDSAHAALIASGKLPPSPEHIPEMLKKQFVDSKLLSQKYVVWYRDLYILAHKILHGIVKEIKGKEIELWQKRTEEFVSVMVKLVKKLIQ